MYFIFWRNKVHFLLPVCSGRVILWEKIKYSFSKLNVIYREEEQKLLINNQQLSYYYFPIFKSGLILLKYSSNKGTVKSISPWCVEQIIPLLISWARVEDIDELFVLRIIATFPMVHGSSPHFTIAIKESCSFLVHFSLSILMSTGLKKGHECITYLMVIL